MAHHHYQTECFVLGGVQVGEAHLFLTLFTEELGLLRAIARSVRTERSKLRYALQDLSHTHVSLVRGRDVWRVTGAVAREYFPGTLHADRQKLELMARLAALLRRLAPGEERNDCLFGLYAEAVRYLIDALPATSLSDFEHLLVLRVLAALGYRSKEDAFRLLVDAAHIDTEVLSYMKKNRIKAISEINALLTVSQL